MTRILAMLIAGILGAVSFAASATTPLPVGSTLDLTDYTDTANYAYTQSIGSTVLTNGSTTFSSVIGGATFDGLLRWWVYSDDANNPNGGLTFQYNFFTGNNDHAPGTIDRFTVDSWLPGISIDAALYGGGKQSLPMSVDRSADGTIGWNWSLTDVTDPMYAYGGTSASLFLLTNATQYGSAFAAITGGTAPIATVGAVVPAVPEPQTYAMLLAGLGLIGFMVRRKAHNNFCDGQFCG